MIQFTSLSNQIDPPDFYSDDSYECQECLGCKYYKPHDFEEEGKVCNEECTAHENSEEDCEE